jgi:hypothetical protein
MSKHKLIASSERSYAEQVFRALELAEVKKAVIDCDPMHKYYVCYILQKEDGWHEAAEHLACEIMQDLKVTFDGVIGTLCYVDEELTWSEDE